MIVALVKCSRIIVDAYFIKLYTCKWADLVHDLWCHPTRGTNKGEPLSLLLSRGWQTGGVIEPTTNTKVWREGGREGEGRREKREERREKREERRERERERWMKQEQKSGIVL